VKPPATVANIQASDPRPELQLPRACQDVLAAYQRQPVLQLLIVDNMPVTSVADLETYCTRLPRPARQSRGWRLAQDLVNGFAKGATAYANGASSGGSGWYVSTYTNQAVAGPFVLLNECTDMAGFMSKRYFNVSTVCQSK
jgi:hypothetical protein